jgi:hypothetical protein
MAHNLLLQLASGFRGARYLRGRRFGDHPDPCKACIAKRARHHPRQATYETVRLGSQWNSLGREGRDLSRGPRIG